MRGEIEVRLLILPLLLFCGVLQAKNGLIAPLMPPRERASVSTPPISSTLKTSLSRSERQALGFEVGTLGIRNNTSNDVAGFQFLFGLRANYVYPLSSRIFLKPQLGYFFRPESSGEVSLTQNLINLGLGAQYSLIFKPGFLLHVGISQHLDYLFSRISVYGSSSNTPSTFQYRVGPSTGVRLKIGPQSDLTFDFEGGVIPTDSFRTQLGFTSGLIFFIN
jgi:hypothetical protein